MAPEAGSLNKSSCLAQALGLTRFIIVTDMIFDVLLRSHLDVQQTHLWDQCYKLLYILYVISHSTITPLFCVIKQNYCGKYHGMEVNTPEL